MRFIEDPRLMLSVLRTDVQRPRSRGRHLVGPHDVALPAANFPIAAPSRRIRARHVCSQCAPMSLHHTGLAIGAAAATVVGLILMVVNIVVGALVTAVAVAVTVEQTVVLLRRLRTMQSKLRRRLSIDPGSTPFRSSTRSPQERI